MALDKDMYKRKIKEMLDDNDTYIKINKDSTRKLTKLKKILMWWKQADYISEVAYRNMNCSDGVLLRAYGSLKIHKPTCPFRIIILSIDSPLHAFVQHFYIR